MAGERRGNGRRVFCKLNHHTITSGRPHETLHTSGSSETPNKSLGLPARECEATEKEKVPKNQKAAFSGARKQFSEVLYNRERIKKPWRSTSKPRRRRALRPAGRRCPAAGPTGGGAVRRVPLPPAVSLEATPPRRVEPSPQREGRVPSPSSCPLRPTRASPRRQGRSGPRPAYQGATTTSPIARRRVSPPSSRLPLTMHR
mmetsp:Transcript_6042/g.13882  ORF Transcript_6042/g.13882 Transcript_6042/m.13882 type:complete len:201 (+) Transcript_6042:530-1132(+)